jgi:hypothetical protein
MKMPLKTFVYCKRLDHYPAEAAMIPFPELISLSGYRLSAAFIVLRVCIVLCYCMYCVVGERERLERPERIHRYGFQLFEDAGRSFMSG